MKQYGETTAFKVYFYKVVADFPTDSLQYMQASCPIDIGAGHGLHHPSPSFRVFCLQEKPTPHILSSWLGPHQRILKVLPKSLLDLPMESPPTPQHSYLNVHSHMFLPGLTRCSVSQ